MQVLNKDGKQCPECNGKLQHKDGELVCGKCGLVVRNVLHVENRIPMGETRRPTCPIDAFTPSGGKPLTGKSLHKVVAVNYGEGEAIPINQIKILIQRNKHPIIQAMDLYGSQLMDRFLNRIVGRKSKTSEIFGHKFGDAINRVGLILALTNDGRKARRMTEVCFLWVWIKMNLPNVKALRYSLWPKHGGVPEIREVMRILNQTPPKHSL